MERSEVTGDSGLYNTKREVSENLGDFHVGVEVQARPRNRILVLSRSQVTASWNLRGKGFACAAPAAGGCPWVPERFRGTIVRSLASLRTNLLEIFGEAADSLLASFLRLLACSVALLRVFSKHVSSTSYLNSEFEKTSARVGN